MMLYFYFIYVDSLKVHRGAVMYLKRVHLILCLAIAHFFTYVNRQYYNCWKQKYSFSYQNQLTV